MLSFVLSLFAGDDFPDLAKKEDLKSLGKGRIIERDNSNITDIMLFEVHEYWIVYVKDESLHEMMMEEIKRIEFRETKWGALKISFPKNTPIINRLNN